MMKKIFVATLLCALTLTQAYARFIPLQYLERSTMEAAVVFLQHMGYELGDIPVQFIREYNYKIETVVSELSARARREGRTSINDLELSQELNAQLTQFCNNLKTIVPSHLLDARASAMINQEFSNYGIKPDAIPTSMSWEYTQKRQNVITELRKAMDRDGRMYVRINEIEKVIKDHITPFLEKVRAEAAKATSLFSSAASAIGSFFGPSPKPTAPADPNSFSRYQLDQKVLEVANKRLTVLGVDANDIPAFAVAEYSEKIQKVISTLTGRMSSAGRDYVTLAEIEHLVRQELEPLAKKITAGSTTCSICLDDYVKGESASTLNCGHKFHNDCVTTWFMHKQSCPLCNQYPAMISSTNYMY
jgi:hypothetical protein